MTDHLAVVRELLHDTAMKRPTTGSTGLRKMNALGSRWRCSQMARNRDSGGHIKGYKVRRVPMDEDAVKGLHFQ